MFQFRRQLLGADISQEEVLGGLCRDLLSCCRGFWTAPEADLGGGPIADTFLISAIFSMLYEVNYAHLKFAFQKIVFQQYAFFKCLFAALDLSDVSAHGTV